MAFYPNFDDINKDFNKGSINKHIDNHSYLCWAVSKDDLKSAITLLKFGASPNGITDIGLEHKIPLTSVNFSSDNSNTVVRTLLKYGADINAEDLSGHNLLSQFMKYMFSKDVDTEPSKNNSVNQQNKWIKDHYIKQLLFILERGANPNGTIFNNPLLECIAYLEVLKHQQTLDFLLDIFEILIAFGANPNVEVINLTNNIYTTAKLSLGQVAPKLNKRYKISKDKVLALVSIKKLFDLDIDEVIKDCSSKRLIISISKLYKIPVPDELFNVEKDTQKHLNALCKCIKTIKDSKEDYDEELFKKIRGHNRRKIKTVNQDLLMGADIDSFPDNELVYLYEKEPKLTFCFHVSDIPSLLRTRTNPYNNRPLDEEFIEQLVNKYQYMLPKTLEETLTNVFDRSEIKITTKLLMSILSYYVKTFNHYIEVERLLEINYKDLIELLNMIYSGDPNLIAINIPMNLKMKLVGETDQEAQQRILRGCVILMLSLLQKAEKSLPLIANIIDQLCNDVSSSKQILAIFPAFRRKNIKPYLLIYSYKDFIRSFDKFVINAENDISLILSDRKFMNSLTDDEKNVVQFLDYNDFIHIYRKYVDESIKEVLSTRFGIGINVNEAWKDIAPALIRSDD